MAVAPGKNEIRLLPGEPCPGLLVQLAVLVVTERIDDLRGDGEAAPAPRRLRLDQLVLVVDPLQLVIDANVPHLKINVTPAQTERLTLSQTHRQCDGVKRLKPITFDRDQESMSLVTRERLDLLLLDSRALHHSRRIAVEVVPLHGVVESCAQGSVH